MRINLEKVHDQPLKAAIYFIFIIFGAGIVGHFNNSIIEYVGIAAIIIGVYLLFGDYGESENI